MSLSESMDGDPLTTLVVVAEDVNRKLLADVLGPYVVLGKETGEMIPKSEYRTLSTPLRILVFLLARKAAIALKMPLAGEGASPTEIGALAGINVNTVKPTVSNLFHRKLLQKRDGVYFVPNHAVLAIQELLTKESAGR